MKFSKMQQEARKIILESEKDVGIEELWKMLGKKKTNFWRAQACELMRTLCLKSELHPPAIERKSKLGRGSKAIYGKKDSTPTPNA